MDVHALLCFIGLAVSFPMAALVTILGLKSGASKPYLALVFLEAGLYFLIPLTGSMPVLALILSFGSALYGLPSLYFFIREATAEPCGRLLPHYVPALVNLPLGVGFALAVSANGFRGGLLAAVYIVSLQLGQTMQLVLYGRAALRLVQRGGGGARAWTGRLVWTAITGYGLFLLLGWISLASELAGDMMGRRITIIPETGLLSSIVAVLIAWTIGLWVLWGRDYGSPESSEARKYGGRVLSEDAAALTGRFRELLEKEPDLSSPEVCPRGLAARLDTPYYIVSRAVNEREGMSVSDLINEYRIARAKKLLESEPESSILDIAFDIGFKSKSTFNAAFKKRTGVTPREYRAARATEG